MRLVKALCCLAVFAVGGMGAQAFAAVAPPGSNTYGASYAQHAGDWTRWALEMPSTSSPFTGTAGCEEHQQGRVFFLPIQFGPGATFACDVSTGQSLLVTPIGGVCSPADGDGTTLAELRACAQSVFALVTHVSVRIDGVAVRDAQRWQFTSPLVPVNFPQHNILDATAGPSSAITAGWFYLVRPLPPGAHTIVTHATLMFPFGPVTVSFHYAITVHGGSRR
jgi:hypothetical protein